jgi:hypothetical protein
MLTLCFAVTVSAKIVLIVQANLEVNMKTILRVLFVGGGAALLGRSGDMSHNLQEIRMR